MNLKHLLNEIDQEIIAKYINKWIGYYHEAGTFNKSVFTYIKKNNPETNGYGKIYRYIKVNVETMKDEITRLYYDLKTEYEPGYNEKENNEISSKIDKLIDDYLRDFIYTTGLKLGYCSYSSTKNGVMNFIGLSQNLYESDYMNYFIISQKSNFIDLTKLPFIDKEKKDELNYTNECIAIIEPNFKIEGVLIKSNQILPYRKYKNLYTQTPVIFDKEGHD